MNTFVKKTGLYLLLVLVSACKSNEPSALDTDPPVITVTSPASGSTFKAGEQIIFEAVFEDNVDLAIYNINVHQNFDGHSHGRIAVSPFSFDKSFPISGKRAVVSEAIDIPANAQPGDYHFIVKAIDEARNSTNFADGSTREIDIKIVDN